MDFTRKQQNEWKDAQPKPEEGNGRGRARGRGRGPGRGRGRGRGRGSGRGSGKGRGGKILKRPSAAAGKQDAKKKAPQKNAGKKAKAKPKKLKAEEEHAAGKKPEKRSKAPEDAEAIEAKARRSTSTFARRYCPKSGPNREKWLGLRDVWQSHLAPKISHPSKYEDFLGIHQSILKPESLYGSSKSTPPQNAHLHNNPTIIVAGSLLEVLQLAVC